MFIAATIDGFIFRSRLETIICHFSLVFPSVLRPLCRLLTAGGLFPLFISDEARQDALIRQEPEAQAGNPPKIWVWRCFVKKTAILSSLFLMIVLWSLCLSARASDDPAVEILVVKNDTVIQLCQKYLDDPAQWMQIVEFNRLSNRDLIYPGQKILIPVRYLKGLPAPGRVAFFKGDVRVREKADGEWKPLSGQERLEKGASIQTGADGAVEILFDDGTSLIQQSHTVLEILKTQTKAGGSLWRRFLLQSGRLILHVRRAMGKEQRLEIQTPAAVAVARGTDFRVRVDDRGDTASEVLEGRIDVGAMNQTVELSEGYGTKVKKGLPPMKPRPLMPPPEPVDIPSVYRKTPLVFTVKAFSGAVSNRFVLTRDETQKDALYERVVPNGQPFLVPVIDDGVYYLSVRSIDETGIEGLSAPPMAVRVRVNPLPPFIQSPVDGARIKSKKVSFNWLRVDQAAFYEIEVSPDPLFEKTSVQRMKTPQNTHDVELAEFGAYYFRVRAVADDGHEGLWSDRIAFHLIAPPPSPSVDTPQLEEKSLHIRWQDQGAGKRYRCQISRDRSFRELIADKMVSEPSLILDRPVQSGLYFVRIQTLDAEGYAGGFSEPQTFEIKSAKDPWVVVGAYGIMLIIILLLP